MGEHPKDIKRDTVERQTREMVETSRGRLTYEQAKKINVDSAERCNRAREKEQKR